MNKQLLIVEESLRDLKAHWFEYIKTIADVSANNGWNTEVVCHIAVDKHIADTLNTLPVFKYARYLDNNSKSYPGEKYIGFIVHSIRVLKAMWPVLKKKKYDHIFVPTVLIHHLLAWYVIAAFHPNRPKRITLFFVTNPGVWNKDNKVALLPQKTILLKSLLRFFAGMVRKGKVTMAVETDGAKREFEQLAGFAFVLLPHPVPFLPKQQSTTNSYSGPLVFSCLGFARHEKGSDILKQVLLSYASSGLTDKKRFLVQWLDAFRMPDQTFCSNQELKSLDFVQLIDFSLKETEYANYLKQTDCMILPYRNSSYYARVSRIAIEAVSMGIPVIYTSGGWLQELMEKFGAGIGIEDESEQELINAIEKMQLNYSDYKQKALERITSVQEYFTPENFCKLLLQND